MSNVECRSERRNEKCKYRTRFTFQHWIFYRLIFNIINLRQWRTLQPIRRQGLCEQKELKGEFSFAHLQISIERF
jgi:hypothetical protein